MNRNLSNCENSPKKRFSGLQRDSNPWPLRGLNLSINWPASSVWAFIAQLGEHCSANAEATGSNPVEAPKIFFSGYFRNCLNCDSLRWSHTHFIDFTVIKASFFVPLNHILFPEPLDKCCCFSKVLLDLLDLQSIYFTRDLKLQK